MSKNELNYQVNCVYKPKHNGTLKTSEKMISQWEFILLYTTVYSEGWQEYKKGKEKGNGEGMKKGREEKG